MPESSDSPSAKKAADSPLLAQLKARKAMLEQKIAERIPQSALQKEEALARAKSHLGQVTKQILKIEGKK